MSHPPSPAQTHHLTIEQTTTALSIELCVHGSTGPMNRPIPPLASMIHTMLALRRMCLVGRPFSRTVMRVQTFDGRDELPKEENEDEISRQSRSEAEKQSVIPMRFFRVRQNARPFKAIYCRSIYYHQPTESIVFCSNQGVLLFWRRKEQETKKEEGQPSSSASSEIWCDSSVMGDGTGAIIVDGPTTETSSSYQLVTASYPSTLRIFDIIEPEIGKQSSLVEATKIDMDAAFKCRFLFHICPRPWDHRRVILGHSSGIALFDLDSRKIVKSNTRFGVRVMGMCIVESSSPLSSSSTPAAERFVACCADGNLFFWSADLDEDIAIQKAPLQGEHMDIVALPRSMRCQSASQSLNLLAVSNSISGVRIIECPTLSTARSVENKNENVVTLARVVSLREISTSVGILPLCILPWDLVEDWVEDEPLC